MRSSFSIPATANDLPFPLFSLLSPFLEDVSLLVRLIYSFSQMLFLHVFTCILSPTIIVNFFLSISFPSVNKCASLSYLSISKKFS